MTAYFLRVLAVLMIFATPLHAQDAHVPEGYESFEAYEIAMFERIDELAAQQGVDMSTFYEVRDELRAEYAEAEKRNDSKGMAKANALRAHVITRGLERLSQ
jgi:hypothetical protein